MHYSDQVSFDCPDAVCWKKMPLENGLIFKYKNFGRVTYN